MDQRRLVTVAKLWLNTRCSSENNEWKKSNIWQRLGNYAVKGFQGEVRRVKQEDKKWNLKPKSYSKSLSSFLSLICLLSSNRFALFGTCLGESCNPNLFSTFIMFPLLDLSLSTSPSVLYFGPSTMILSWSDAQPQCCSHFTTSRFPLCWDSQFTRQAHGVFSTTYYYSRRFFFLFVIQSFQNVVLVMVHAYGLEQKCFHHSERGGF